MAGARFRFGAPAVDAGFGANWLAAIWHPWDRFEAFVAGAFLRRSASAVDASFRAVGVAERRGTPRVLPVAGATSLF